MTREERDNAIRCLKIWIEREPYIQTYKTCLEALEQEPTVTLTNNSGEMTYPQVEGITPIVVEPMRDATPEERESVNAYIKSISNSTGVKFDEEQEQLDFVQPHKSIPVTLTVKNGDSESKWIPISEKLPEEGVDVLACFYTEEGNYKMMVSRRNDYNYWSGVGRTADMVAWMPLPMPYKKGGETDG